MQGPHYATPARYQATKKTLEKYEKMPVFAKMKNRRERTNATLGAAMTEDLDTAIRMLLKKPDALGLTEITSVVFTADNGYRSWNESHDPLRGAKWWLWECGTRVPLIVRGPGIAPASRNPINVAGYDFLPTFADLAGATGALAKDLDGVSFKRLLFGAVPTEHEINRPRYFHYPHYRISPPASALVVGDTKLIVSAIAARCSSDSRFGPIIRSSARDAFMSRASRTAAMVRNHDGAGAEKYQRLLVF